MTAEIDALRGEKAEWVKVFDDMVLVQQRTEAERDALRAQLVDLGKAYEVRLSDWHALRAEVERLRAALTRYGRHQLLCSFFKDGPHQASPETVCDCGLSVALSSKA